MRSRPTSRRARATRSHTGGRDRGGPLHLQRAEGGPRLHRRMPGRERGRRLRRRRRPLRERGQGLAVPLPAHPACVRGPQAGGHAPHGHTQADATGEAPFTYSGQKAARAFIVACQDVSGDGACGAGDDPFANAVKDWQFRFALSLQPFEATNRVGTSHTVTARLITSDDNQPVVGAPLVFSLDPASANQTAPVAKQTDANGEATFTYSGQKAGRDFIVACQDVSGDGACGAGDDPFANAVKDWQFRFALSLQPFEATNRVGTSHTVTARLITSDDNQPVVGAPLVFSLDPASANQTAPVAKQTDANGEATFTYSGQKAGRDFIVACQDVSGDGACGAGDDPFANAVKDWQFRFALSLQPFEDTNRVGTSHTVTARLITSDDNQPVVGAPLVFSLDPASANQTAPVAKETDANGEATFTYSGQKAGRDFIVACQDVSGDGACGAGDDPFANAVKDWQFRFALSLQPFEATNRVGTSHTVTARLITSDDNQPVVGAPLVFSLDPASANQTAPVAKETDANGEATFTYSGQKAGRDFIVACQDVSGDGACGAGDDPFANAVKDWQFRFALSLQPFEATNRVGTSHTVTARLITSDDNQPVVGAPLVFSLDPASANQTAPVAKQTDANGEATFTYSGQKAGRDFIVACQDVSGDGACGAGDDPFANAVKDWQFRFALSLQPFEDTNRVGTSHTVTARLITSDDNQPVVGAPLVFSLDPASANQTAPVAKQTYANGEATFTYSGQKAG